MNESSIEDLEVSDQIKKKLGKEYASLETLSKESPSEVSHKVGIGLKSAKNIIIKARTMLGIAPMTALELLQEQRTKRYLSTGSQEFDEILGGGIATGSITEFAGEFSSGKSQLCFQLCINAQLSYDLGGLEGKVYFIDTEGTFSAKRILEIASHNRANIDPQELLKNIFVVRAYNADHQLQIIKEADKLLKEENIKLVIIDSIASHFRSEYHGKDQLVERQQKIMAHAEKLQRYADSYDLVIVTTNQVLASIDTYLSGKVAEPALGYAWGHRPHTRIFLRKQKGSGRIARIIDSPELPEKEAVFYITEKGIEGNDFLIDDFD
jgi:DNA repair protein RadA